MAVNKKYKNKIKKNKKKKKNKTTNKNVNKKVNNTVVNKNVIEEVFEQTTVIDTDNKKSYSSLCKNMVIVSCLIVFSVLLVLYFPKIKLNGSQNVVISYKDKYEEPGYVASMNNKDISDKVYLDSNIVEGVIGEYEVNYYVDLFGSKLKKTRYVNVVDRDNPVINTDGDKIDVCPLQDVPDFKYSAYDDYDGDITSSVEKKINEDEVILNVNDSSNNFTSKTIKINRGDNVKPVIKLKGSSVMFVNYGSRYNEPGYEVTDNCSNNLTDRVSVNGTVGKEIGTYTITYSVNDDSGNKATVTRKVIVGKKNYNQGVVNNGTIYLTFDDGPNEGTTNRILDILKEEGVKATFFVTCKGPDYLIKRIYDEGHTIALHTATHNYSYIYSSVDNYFNDLNRVSDRVKRITGIESKIIRFPGGSSNTISRNYKRGIMTELTNLVLNMGYRYFDWNVDAMDASTARSGSDVYYNVVSHLSMNRSNVVLMHDIKRITVDGLRDVIRFGRENGYKFSGIDMNTYMVKHSVNN